MIPIGVVHGIAGGAPKLGIVHQTGPDSAPVISGPVVATTFVNGTAGNIGAKVDNLACAANCGNLTIFFSVGATNLVVFSGAQFNLYLSKDGYSQISPGDVRYAGTFLVSSLSTALVGTNEQNGTYYIGTTNSVGVCTPNCKVVEGPLPIWISGGYSFIKVWDGTAVAALQYITISPGIRLSTNPSGCAGLPMGPANRPVCVSGGGFAPNTLVDLNYSYTFYSWPSGASSTHAGQWQTSVSTTSNGYFSNVYNMIDTKQAVNPAAIHNDVITIWAVKNTYPHTAIANIAPATPAIYTENSRLFNQVISLDQRGTLVSNSGIANYGNDSGFGTILSQPIDVYAFGTLWIAGNYWTWGGSVTFWVSNGTSTGFNQFGSVVTAGSSASNQGNFNASMTVPSNLPIGVHTVKVSSNGVYYTFTIYMNPTLVLTPYQGTASNPSTLVTVTGYGFPAGILVLLYWNETSYHDGNEYNVANATTGPNGQFNNTTPVTFWVPETYGGNHLVSAWNAAAVDFSDFGGTDAVVPNSNPGCTEGVESFCEENLNDGVFSIASTTFTVLPSLVICPGGICPTAGSIGTFNSTYAGNVVAVGEGFVPGTYYSVNVDNQMADFSTACSPFSYNAVVNQQSTVTSTTSSTSTILTTVAGEPEPDGDGDDAPYLPVVQVVTTQVFTSGQTTIVAGCTPLHGLVTPAENGVLNMTFIGAGFRPGLHVLSLTNNDETGSAGNYAPSQHALFNVTTPGDPIAAMFAGITVTLNSISTSISSLSSAVSALQTSVNSLQTSVNSLTTTVNGISSSLSSLTTTVNGIQTSVTNLNTWANSAQSSLTSISNDVTTIKNGVAGITTTLSDLGGKINSIQTSVAGISGVGNTASSILSAVQAEQLYVLVVVVLAAITLVLVLAVLIRKLS